MFFFMKGNSAQNNSNKDGKVHLWKRVPDVLDVRLLFGFLISLLNPLFLFVEKGVAGCAAWNCLGFPALSNLKNFEEWFPAAFILEGRDQIRGWFNLLHVLSMVAFDRPAFKACYMHGFINDSEGRKMSKSMGNFITPEEVTAKVTIILHMHTFPC